MINCKLEHVKIRIVALVMEGNRKFVRNLTLSESPPFYPMTLDTAHRQYEKLYTLYTLFGSYVWHTDNMYDARYSTQTVCMTQIGGEGGCGTMPTISN